MYNLNQVFDLIDATENNLEQPFTLTLTNDLIIKSDQQIDDVPVFASNTPDGLYLTLKLPLEFNRCVFPIAVDLEEPIKGSEPIHLLNND